MKLTRFSRDDTKKNYKLYHEYIHEYKMANGWLPGNQLYNFRELLKLAGMSDQSYKGTSILDVGCGTGDFLPLLHEEKIKNYLGIDIYEPSIIEARKEHPHEQFILGDLLIEKITEVFDYAFCSGGFTVKLSQNNYDFLTSMLERMWNLTTKGLAFNVLTDDDYDQDPDLFFYTPDKVLQICYDIAPDAILSAIKTPNLSQIHVYMYRDPEEA